MTYLIQILSLLILGMLLFLACVGYVHLWIGSFGRPTVLVAPVEGTAGLNGEPLSTAAGEALARAITVRLAYLKESLDSSQRALVSPRGAGAAATGASSSASPLDLTTVELPRRTFQPVDLNVAVQGVETGPIVRWVQSIFVRPRLLKLSVISSRDRFLVSGHLPWRGGRSIDVWTSSAEDSDELVVAASLALLKGILEAEGHPFLAELSPAEFQELVDAIEQLADHNRSLEAGVTVPETRWREVLEPLIRVSLRVPDWHEVKLLAAKASYNAGLPEDSHAFYEELRAASGLSPRLRSQVDLEFRELFPRRSGELFDFIDKPGHRGFEQRVKSFAERIGVEPVPLQILPLSEAIPAQWDDGSYAVNADRLDEPGLDRYVALMGHFFALHQQDCAETIDRDGSVWNEVRKTLVYLALFHDSSARREVPIIRPSEVRGYRFFRVVSDFASEAGLSDKKAQELSVFLIESYDCSWTRENIAEKTDAALRGRLTSVQTGKLVDVLRWHYGDLDG